MTRWIGFFIAIVIGAAAGLYYGWVLNPVKYVDTTPDTLREDYKSDYVLMVAEAYAADRNIEVAVQHLAILGELAPAERVDRALVFAAKNGYAEIDQARLQTLADALKNWNPLSKVPTP